MKAIVLKEAGEPSNLQIAEADMPVIRENEVLVKVSAFSINPVDVKTRLGKALYTSLKAEHEEIIIGWDISGTVVETGAGVRDLKQGDEVFGMINFPGYGQAYAEYVAAPAAHLAKKPAKVSHEEAAAATLAALTAWQALVTNAKVQAGQKVLIHAASGGVGHYAVQIAKHLGAYVIGTSSGANKEFVLSLGADEHVDYNTQRLEDHVHHADFVLDSIGGDHVDHSLAVTKPGGTVIVLPSKSLLEEKTEKAKQKNINCYFFMVASGLGDMPVIASLLEQGVIRSHVAEAFSFEQTAAAHAAVESGRTVGKIVVTV